MSPNAENDKFVDLQASFYAAFIQGLGFSLEQPAQVVQPAQIVYYEDKEEKKGDALLWRYLDVIPEKSLTRNTTLSTGIEFLSNYSAVLANLQAKPNDFRKVVGEDCADAYATAVAQHITRASPEGFRDWCMLTKWSSVAVTGASALARALLDPVYTGQMKILGYASKAADFSIGYKLMTEQLAQAPRKGFSATVSWSDSNIQKTWTSGTQTAIFGLLKGGSTSDVVSRKFSSSGVIVNFHAENLLSFAPIPGDWYTSSTFALAYAEKGVPPWTPNAQPNWNDAFGPDKGVFQRFTTVLLIANEMVLSYISEASFSEAEQAQIEKSASLGLWPFYTSTSESRAETTHSFDSFGKLHVQTTTKKDVATIIGAVVQPAKTYIGPGMEAAVAQYKLLDHL
jgi:hypothetical protein